MASLTNLDPATLKRRSFIYRKLTTAGAEFAEINGGAVAMRYPARAESEAAIARRMGLADLSVLPHGGFKGRGTVEWLTNQGLIIGADSNKAYLQADGELAARLEPTEMFLTHHASRLATTSCRSMSSPSPSSNCWRVWRPASAPVPMSHFASIPMSMAASCRPMSAKPASTSVITRCSSLGSIPRA